MNESQPVILDFHDAGSGNKELARLEEILDASFTGLYLWHARKTLRNVDAIKVALVGNDYVGLIMLKSLNERSGYIYYVAVDPATRSRGIGGRLVEAGLEWARLRSHDYVFAAVEEDNTASKRLFQSRGFERVGFGWLRTRFGIVEATRMSAEMRVVPGEELLVTLLKTSQTAHAGLTA